MEKITQGKHRTVTDPQIQNDFKTETDPGGWRIKAEIDNAYFHAQHKKYSVRSQPCNRIKTAEFSISSSWMHQNSCTEYGGKGKSRCRNKYYQLSEAKLVL